MANQNMSYERRFEFMPMNKMIARTVIAASMSMPNIMSHFRQEGSAIRDIVKVDTATLRRQLIAENLLNNPNLLLNHEALETARKYMTTGRDPLGHSDSRYMRSCKSGLNMLPSYKRHYDYKKYAIDKILTNVLLLSVLPDKVKSDSTYNGAIQSFKADKKISNLYEHYQAELRSMLIEGKTLNKEQLTDLSLAIDAMQLISSSTIGLYLRQTNKSETKLQRYTDASNHFNKNAAHFSALAAKHGLHDKKTDDTEKLFIGLDNLWRFASQLLSGSSHSEEEPHVLKRRLLTNMVEVLEEVFIKNNNIMSLPKSVIKGKSHELLWMLDGYILILSDKKYDGLTISPSPRFMDQPIIDKPHKNRGVDYIVSHNMHGNYCACDFKTMSFCYHQLKSGAHDKKEYHPDILLSKEDNFNREIFANKKISKRFKIRIDTYKELIENDFDRNNRAMRRFLHEGYCLDSVKQALDHAVESIA